MPRESSQGQLCEADRSPFNARARCKNTGSPPMEETDIGSLATMFRFLRGVHMKAELTSPVAIGHPRFPAIPSNKHRASDEGVGLEIPSALNGTAANLLQMNPRWSEAMGNQRFCRCPSYRPVGQVEVVVTAQPRVLLTVNKTANCAYLGFKKEWQFFHSARHPATSSVHWAAVGLFGAGFTFKTIPGSSRCVKVVPFPPKKPTKRQKIQVYNIPW